MAKEKRFIVETPKTKGGMVQIITDTETGVQYLLGLNPGLGSGMTVLVDKDGKPLLNNTAKI
ncbi:DUF6440 family protein [Companilactobacillus baiquanensis]|uniref:DUF6440 family protein n=1 Tax=Companilactobacillus baiquanensis TaxID=2486005 RepID=A0ABW1USS1_9LACO|nr:DUF6440 family protein [Companilactobacillus baiquanensis]